MSANYQTVDRHRAWPMCLNAEGARQAAILNAEGYAAALARIYESAQNVDSKTMSLQYLDALKALGAGPATKFIFPMEFTGLTKAFSRFTSEAGSDG